jgi:uncharacterized delta-60 repeat protein
MWQTILGLSDKSPKHRPNYRLRLENLEDRCLLSAGALDPTFGNGAGYVSTSMTNYWNVAYVPLVQPDGKIVAVGDVLSPEPGTKKGTTITHEVFGVARYNTDGSLDTSFGTGGTAQANFGPNSAYAWGAALYPNAGTANDGKLVLAGWYTPPAARPNQVSVSDLALARFNANGSLDATFGSGGEVLTSFSVGGVSGAGVVVTSAGQIVIAGQGPDDIVLARYSANGSLDSTFGQEGRVVTPFTQVEDVEHFVQQPDGKFIVVGATSPDNVADHYKWQIVRYNADGSLDKTFGSGGIISPQISGFARDAAVYPAAGTSNDGMVVVVGGGTIVRYSINGAPDPAFGTNGVVSSPVGLSADAIATDGRVVAVGTYGGGVTVARYNTDGKPDNSFGTGGMVINPSNEGGTAQGVALQPNGDIVVAGEAPSSTNGNFLVARFLPSEPEIGTFTSSASTVTSGSSVTLTASNLSDANPNSTITQVAFYLNGTLLGYGTQTSPGVWTLTFTVNLAPGTYTLSAQARDSYGVLGDLASINLQVI